MTGWFLAVAFVSFALASVAMEYFPIAAAYVFPGILGEQYARAGALWAALMFSAGAALLALYELAFGTCTVWSSGALVLLLERCIRMLLKLSERSASAAKRKRRIAHPDP
jgi:hypothetical protein